MATSGVIDRKQKSGQSRLFYHTLILIGVCATFVLLLTSIQPFFGLNLKLTDQLFTSVPPSSNIVIVGMDDTTFQNYGVQSDWPRSMYATALNNLRQAGARVIGVDVLFSDVSPDDAQLVKAIQNAGDVVLPVVGAGNPVSANSMVMYPDILKPLSSFIQASNGIGHADLVPDRDGTIRSVPLVIKDVSGNTYPAFSLAVMAAYLGQKLPASYSVVNGELHALSLDMPVDNNFRMLIDFSSDSAGRPYLSFGDVVSGNFDPSIVKNKIVLIGFTATGETDKWFVPVSSDKMPGVYIHAAVIDNLLNKHFLADASSGTNLLILLLLIAIIGLSLPRLGLRWGGLLVVGLFVAYLLAGFYAFDHGHILNLLYPLSILPIGYIGNVLIQHTFTLLDNSRLNREIASVYTSTIMALAASIDAKDSYTRGHSQRVTEMALQTARVLELPPDEIRILEYAGILHDIGKIGIPDAILRKNGRLTDEEWAIIKQHPVMGAKIIDDIPFLEEVKNLVLHHHERYDGKGYPDGLSGENIPLGARLLTVADAFDSMTTDRAYRPKMTFQVAYDELEKCSGTQFWPVAVEAFVKAVRRHDTDNNVPVRQ